MIIARTGDTMLDLCCGCGEVMTIMDSLDKYLAQFFAGFAIGDKKVLPKIEGWIFRTRLCRDSTKTFRTWTVSSQFFNTGYSLHVPSYVNYNSTCQMLIE